MPPVSQFPPARVFLKSPTKPIAQSIARRTSLTLSPVPRPLTTTSSTTSRSPSATAAQQSTGALKCSGSSASDRAIAPNGPIFKIYGAQLRKVKTAFLDPPYQPLPQDQVRKEKQKGREKEQERGAGKSSSFSPSSPSSPSSSSSSALPFPYTRAGFFHIAGAAPLGGTQIGETVRVGPGDAQRAVDLSDPWGNVVEVLSWSFEALLANTG